MVNCNNIKSVSGFCKIAETVMLLIAITIQRGTNVPFGSTEDFHIFCMGVLVTGLIVTPILLLCYLFDKSITRSSILEPVLNFALFGLLMIASIMCLVFWTHHTVIGDSSKRSQGIVLGCFVLFSSLAYLGDTAFSCMLYFRS